MIHFPSVKLEEFDFETDWLVKLIDDAQKQVLFEGQGKNADLELEMSFEDNPAAFETLSVGELVSLPSEVFLASEEATDQEQVECF